MHYTLKLNWFNTKIYIRVIHLMENKFFLTFLEYFY